MKIKFVLNGKEVETEAPPNMTLADFLHDIMGLTGVKKGCDTGECGACTVLLNDKPITSCLVLAPQVNGKDVKTIEYISRTELGSRIVDAFKQTDSVQCGYCIPGMIITAHALISSKRTSEDEAIKEYMSGNICRCGGYVNQLKAIKFVLNLEDSV